MNESRGDMSGRHREEWETFRANGLAALLREPGCPDEKQVKTMKYIAETLRITQDGERRACEFGEGERSSDTPLQFVWDDGGSNGGHKDTL